MENYEIDLGMLLSILKKRWWLICMVVVLCGAIGFSFANYYLVSMYQASVKLYVYSDPSRETAGATVSATSAEMTASKSLVDTYLVVLESDTVLDKVIDNLQLNCSTNYLRSLISCSAINDTEVFSVSVTYMDPKIAQTIVNAIADIAPNEIIRVVKAGGVEVVDYAKLPTDPVSPSVSRYTLLFALVGFVLSYSVMLLMAITDTKVRDEDDLMENFDIPVLGSIPGFDNIVSTTTKKKEGGTDGSIQEQ